MTKSDCGSTCDGARCAIAPAMRALRRRAGDNRRRTASARLRAGDVRAMPHHARRSAACYGCDRTVAVGCTGPPRRSAAAAFAPRLDARCCRSQAMQRRCRSWQATRRCSSSGQSCCSAVRRRMAALRTWRVAGVGPCHVVVSGLTGRRWARRTPARRTTWTAAAVHADGPAQQRRPAATQAASRRRPTARTGARRHGRPQRRPSARSAPRRR